MWSEWIRGSSDVVGNEELKKIKWNVVEIAVEGGRYVVDASCGMSGVEAGGEHVNIGCGMRWMSEYWGPFEKLGNKWLWNASGMSVEWSDNNKRE